MESYDFDPHLQKVFNDQFKDLPVVDWKKWRDLSSREDYESLAQKMSGFTIEEIEEADNATDPRSLSLDGNAVLNPDTEDSSLNGLYEDRTLIVCHTSGTSAGDIHELKWYRFSKDTIRRLWTPGMRAIFESSGMRSSSSSVVFVPSRIQVDGNVKVDGKRLIRLYSSEFSQRLAISILKPEGYVLDEYKNFRTLQTVSKILSLSDVSTVSAPAAILLGWADIGKLRAGLERSLKGETEASEENPVYMEMRKMIEKRGLEKSSMKIQKELSDLLSRANLIFSTTALKEDEWAKLRSFLKWSKGEEKVTNLYVGSETGPFAASIERGEKISMRVFPLTLPFIERKGKRELISRTGNRFGKLLISRNAETALVNIDTGDVITIEGQDGLPKISGEILRSAFELKNVSTGPMRGNGKILTGDYFNFGDFEIISPKRMLNCLEKKLNVYPLLKGPAMLVSGDPNKMILPLDDNNLDKIRVEIPSCPGSENLDNSIKNSKLILESGATDLNDSLERSRLYKLVKVGKLPKGVLKKWPLYVVVPQSNNIMT